MQPRRFNTVLHHPPQKWWQKLLFIYPKPYLVPVEVPPHTEDCMTNPDYVDAKYEEVVLRGQALVNVLDSPLLQQALAEVDKSKLKGDE